MSRIHAGVTILEQLVALAAVAILIAVTVPVMAHTSRAGGTRLDAKQIIDIHAGFLLFAADGDGTLPTPGLIDTIGPVPGGPQDYDQNDSAAVYSSAIAQLYITTRQLIGPTEVNPVVIHDDDYDFEAYDPAADVYWDAAFRMEIFGLPETHEANASYAHMAVCGDRRDLKWRDTDDANDPVLGTRGILGGVGPGNAMYDRSPTLLLHGPPDVWVGNVVFHDHAVRLLDHFFPTMYAPPGREPQPDNMFAADFAHPFGPEAAADAWLAIARAAGPAGWTISAIADRLLPE